MQQPIKASPQPSIFSLLQPYRAMVALLVVVTLAGNGLNLLFPHVIADAIDAFAQGVFSYETTIWQFVGLALAIFVLTIVQNIVQTYASEKVARDLRTKLSAKISQSSYLFVQKTDPAKLLTYLTADIDAVKLFVAQVIASLLSSLVIIIGTSIMLLVINVKLGLAVLVIIPIITATFFIIFGKVKTLFMQSRDVLDRLNKVINESILGSALIRVLHGQENEHSKFGAANANARDLGLKILGHFAAMIPIVTFVANAGTLIILLLGGHYVMNGTVTIGDFAAFTSYVAILIFPIFIIGFMMSVMSQAGVSYQRIVDVLEAKEEGEKGTVKKELHGDIEVRDVTVMYGEKAALQHVSFVVAAGKKTAIIGPTAAGKTQLLYLLTALTEPTSGTILYDGQPIATYDSESLHRQIGFVFQDSVLFNLSIRDNIAFGDSVTDEMLQKAIDTAELSDFVATLPEGLNTVVSERGTSLSGGQKQRVMLARALALNPKVLLLDDFTARVDGPTEQRILANITQNYPELTLVSVTQKIASVEHYDEIVLLMEGEVLAKGTHAELLESSPEYVQIYESQRSTNHYEVHA